MATANIGVTPIDAFIPEIWSKEVIYQANNKSIFQQLVRTDFDGEINTQGDTVHVPLFSNVTVGTKSENTAVAYTNYTESNKDIAINTHQYFAFRIEDIASVQASPSLVAGYTRQGGAALATSMDVSIANLITNSAVTQNVGTVTSGAYVDITDANIRNAVQKLDEANAPEEDRYLVISPAQKNAMLGIDKFVDASKFGSDAPVRQGFFGQIYNVWVLVSNNLPDVAIVSSSSGAGVVYAHKRCMMFHKEAFALAQQINPRVQAAYDLDHLATKVVGDMLYGTGVLVPTYAVQIRTTSEA